MFGNDGLSDMMEKANKNACVCVCAVCTCMDPFFWSMLTWKLYGIQ
jgi:hypothetical protein